MSNSLNRTGRTDNIFIKSHGPKTPLWRYYIRSSLDFLGFHQPIEYCNNQKRLNFEAETLLLWKNFGLSVPDILYQSSSELHLSFIRGRTLLSVLLESFDLKIISMVIKDMNYRHRLAFTHNEPRLCHVDANLRNILYSKGSIIHVDFEMGRNYETVERWATREVSKLMVSLFKDRSSQEIDNIIQIFRQEYMHKRVIKSIVCSKLKNSKKKYEKKRTKSFNLYRLAKILEKDLKPDYRKILVIKFRNIGDVLLTTPLAFNIRHHYPSSDIDFAVNQGCEDMLTHNPNIASIISYSRLRIKKLNWLSQVREELRLVRQIRSNQYDLVINLTEGDRGAQLALFSGAKKKLGFRVRKGILSKLKIFDHLGLDNDQKWQHTIEKDLQFIELLNKKVVDKSVSLYWPKKIDTEIDILLAENKVRHFVHIHPVSRWKFKCWEDDRLAKVIDYLQQEKEIKVVITCAPDNQELESIDKILSHCQTEPINLSGKLNLKQLACLSSKAILFLGPDTAPMHMAAAVNTQVVALFGASYPKLWGPWNNQLDVNLFQDIDGVQTN